MKIVTTAIIFFILGGLIVFFVTKKSEVLPAKPASKLETFISTARKPFENIGYDSALHLVQQYKPGVLPSRASNPTGETFTSNTQTVWFDAQTIAELADEVANKGDGVRIYFATYDDNYSGFDSRGVKQNYSNANTLILVPTITKLINGKSYHWDISDSSNSTKKIGFLASGSGDYQNKGELCPPPSNCNMVGASLLPTTSTPATLKKP